MRLYSDSLAGASTELAGGGGGAAGVGATAGGEGATAESVMQNEGMHLALRSPRSIAAAAACATANPVDPAAWQTLGELLLDSGNMPAAADALRRAAQLNPSPVNLANLGSALAGADRLDEALAALQRAAEAAPHWSEAHRGVGAVLYTAGRVDESIAAFSRALAEDPTNAAAHSMLLYMQLFQGTTPPEQIRANHAAWAAAHTGSIQPLPAPANDRSPNRRLRVGYVSPNFRNQAVARFVLPIFEHHDPWEVEIFAYSDALATDATTQRLRARADEWRNTASFSDGELAALVRADRIDILVDLTGHIGGGRLKAFAAKPAPVQVAYLGYQATTGLTAMDYVLSDEWADPRGMTESFWAERVWRLPGAFFCYEPAAGAPEVGPLPALARGLVTFGCQNNVAKVTPRTLEVWAAVMRAVQNSQLMLLTPRSDSVHGRLRAALGERGIAAERVIFVGRTGQREYLDRYNQIDLALDPIPFNGHTTTADAAWMGVPTVSLAGAVFPYRYGGAVMRQCGLADLVTSDEPGYVSTAVRLARDVGRLAEIRALLRGRMQRAGITDGTLFARRLEAAYRGMWGEWCRTGAGLQGRP
jgi:protein O-GlcNAc transferase